METNRRLELSIKTLFATIFLGLTGDLLLRDVPWGFGFALYSLLIFVFGAYLYRQRAQEFGKGAMWLIPPALLFSSLFAWRDDTNLRLLNSTCVALILAAFVLRARSGDLDLLSLLDYPARLAQRWLRFLGDALPLFGLEGRWQALGSKEIGRRVAPVIRGILIAAPLLLLFGSLFASSDRVFDRIVTNAFQFDLNAIWSHVFVILVCLWLIAGFFRSLFLAPETHKPLGPYPEGPKVGITETVIVLGTLNALFLAFVAVQFRYFFGGTNLVQTTDHLSYAQYAREGFFELVWVAVLGLGLLIGAHALVRRSAKRDWLAFVPLASSLIGLMYVVVVSAWTRFDLYVQAYGLTEERFYAAVVLGWFCFLFAWFALTVLRRRHNRFAFGVVASLLVVGIAVNALNPDATIAGFDTARKSGKVDTAYLASLNLEATPALVVALPDLKPDDRQLVLKSLKQRRSRISETNWRSWNLGVSGADRALKSIGL